MSNKNAINVEFITRTVILAMILLSWQMKRWYEENRDRSKIALIYSCQYEACGQLFMLK